MKEAKKSLRQLMAEREKTLSDEYLKTSDEGIVNRFFSLSQYADAEKIFIYYSVRKEPNTVNIISKMLRDGKEVYIPVINCSGYMEAGRIRGVENLPTGALNIPRPLPGCEKILAPQLDIIIVPGVAFDVEGGRLGRGGGYYDRFLAEAKCVKIGIARESMIVDIIPKESHDIYMDTVVTEERIITCNESK